MKIVIVRHGDPDYENDSLTEKGFREAEIVADRITQLDVKEFFVSPLGRAQATAAATLKRLNRDAVVYDWLREFPGRAVDEKGNLRLPWDYMPSDWTKYPLFYDKDGWYNEDRMSKGDVKEAYQNIADGIDSILEKYGYKRDGLFYRTECGNKDTIVIFCHLGAGLAILSHLIGVSALVLWQGCFIAPTSVTTVVSEERIPGEAAWRAVGIGDISHLYAAGEPMSMSGFFDESASYDLKNKA